MVPGIYKASTTRCEERPVAVFRGGALCVFCFLNASQLPQIHSENWWGEPPI